MQNSNYFGRSYPLGLLVPCWMKAITMTATATMYTQFGFAIAADGRQRWGNIPTRDDFIQQSESDTVQKIFAFSSNGVVLAYFIRGHIANRDRSFDLETALEKELAPWRAASITDLAAFLRTIGTGLEQYIRLAHSEGRVEEYPETYIEFMGYLGTQPFWVELQFLRFGNVNTGLLYELSPRTMWPGACLVSGSLIIRDLIFRGHPAFSGFCNLFDYKKSLEQAARYVNGYIQACCSPIAIQFDPDCAGLGGHIHVATVTPESGFQWFVEPVQKRES
jgi:hypothetical protein